ncbi:hypothetical protein HHL16_02940 [Pseudoflavitalea sp. G-6-1-2]|uniref:hypothetical protein n=1 Tax=Pseudoflavitalea sp. G-6-1-2 TaxID=2728841 RepID=UPI00146C32AC|nr:hypothetical protein [Pseudoflavitalea sp. G-6-1-2]NML19809.1 hypothetical protein [Pseudoflavitalea sp. G-6-1-2]
MNAIKPLFIFAVAQAMNLSLHAQEQPTDYLVTNQGDTLWGEFKTGLSGRGTFRSGKKKITVKSADHKSYYDDKKKNLYRTMELPGFSGKKWCRLVDNGVIRLYEFEQSKIYAGAMGNGMNTTSTFTTWYATKDDQNMQEIKTNAITLGRNERKEALRELFTDDPVTLNEFDQAKDFGFHTIRDLIIRYNRRKADSGN